MEEKIDAILKAIQSLTERIVSLENKFDKYDRNFETINNSLNVVNKKIVNLEQSKTNAKSFDELAERVQKLEAFKHDLKKEELMRESYSKRLNLLIHGLEEKKESVWETRIETQEIFNRFLFDGLKLEPNSISLVDIHRLPQHPIMRQEKKVTRPIIIKLSNARDKKTILDSLVKLKKFNENKQHSLQDSTSQSGKSMVYVSEHLPKEFYEQKKQLMPRFKQARSNGDKTRWSAIDGAYRLFVNGKMVE